MARPRCFSLPRINRARLLSRLAWGGPKLGGNGGHLSGRKGGGVPFLGGEGGGLAADLVAHGGPSEAVERWCCDMSLAHFARVEKYLPQADFIYARFHIMRVAYLLAGKLKSNPPHETARNHISCHPRPVSSIGDDVVTKAFTHHLGAHIFTFDLNP